MLLVSSILDGINSNTFRIPLSPLLKQLISSQKQAVQCVNNAKTAYTVTDKTYATWKFGGLPELLEIQKGGQTLIVFPVLIDQGDAVTIEVFDEPETAAD
ncbi:MAG: hypothetical protein RIR79_428 [Pseudomonadota bacterium]|jgi:ATP-dependent helicase HrpA